VNSSGISRKRPGASAPSPPGLAISDRQFTELIDTCRHLDRLDRAAVKLISLTIPA
jgi:hypothetical protein